jgi:hypothetical protein
MKGTQNACFGYINHLTPTVCSSQNAVGMYMSWNSAEAVSDVGLGGTHAECRRFGWWHGQLHCICCVCGGKDGPDSLWLRRCTIFLWSWDFALMLSSICALTCLAASMSGILAKCAAPFSHSSAPHSGGRVESSREKRSRVRGAACAVCEDAARAVCRGARVVFVVIEEEAAVAATRAYISWSDPP